MSNPRRPGKETRGLVRDGTDAPDAGDGLLSPTNVSAPTKDSATTKWVVVDDFPDIVPVTRAELDVIELYLADHLDEILGGHPARK